MGSGLSSLSVLSCPPPPPPCTHSTLCTLCTTAPFPVVLWQYSQLCLPCSPSGDLWRARVLGLLLMFQTAREMPLHAMTKAAVFLPLQIFEKGLEPSLCNGVWHLLVY